MSVDNTLADVIGKQTNKGFFAWLVSRQVFWIFLATVLAFIYLSIATKTFMTPQNLFNVTRNFSLVGIIAVGMLAREASADFTAFSWFTESICAIGSPFLTTSPSFTDRVWIVPDTSAPTLVTEFACSAPEARTVCSTSPRSTATVAGSTAACDGAQ